MAKSASCPFLYLNNGLKIPAVGLGTFQGAFSFEIVEKLVIKAVSDAIDIGYRMFDTAWLYNTEVGLGKALNAKIREGVVKRTDLFVITKLWSTFHAKHDVMKGLKESLANLGMDYVDLFIIHWPMSMPSGKGNFPAHEDGTLIFNDEEISLQETWAGMEQCVKQGLVKSIGVSNYNSRQLLTILEGCSIKPAVNQVESHPYFANSKLLEFCQEKGIHMMCYSPLGYPTRPWAKPDEPVVHKDPTLISIGKSYGKSAGQVALRYQHQRGNSVIPKSSNQQRQHENIDIFDFKLSDKEMQTIKDVDINYKMLLFKDKFENSKEYPFNEEF